MKKILLPTVFILFLAINSYSQEASVISEKANLRSLPAQTGKVVRVLDKDTIVKVVREKSAWFLVELEGAKGWLHRSTVNYVVKEIRYGGLVKLGDVDSNVSLTNESGEQVRNLKATPTPEGYRPKIISGGVLNGKATSLAKPTYPAAARAVHAGGSVTVQVLIDENGRVISASAVSGHPLLRSAAVSAAEASTFSPTLLQGNPVKVSGVITYNFVP